MTGRLRSPRSVRVRRIARIALAAVAVIVALAAAAVLWGLFWPAPSGAPDITCPPHPYHRCVRVAGRVLWHTSFGRGERGHVVLLSRGSLTLPGVVVLEFPYLDHQPQGLGVGDWVVALGLKKTGSHHETDLHVTAFATSAMRATCGYSPYDPCRRLPLRANPQATGL